MLFSQILSVYRATLSLCRATCIPECIHSESETGDDEHECGHGPPQRRQLGASDQGLVGLKAEQDDAGHDNERQSGPQHPLQIAARHLERTAAAYMCPLASRHAAPCSKIRTLIGPRQKHSGAGVVSRPREGGDPFQPRCARSMAAMSIFFISIIASNARLAAARSGSVNALVRAIGVICQDKPHLSLHHPHALSSPPLPTIAFQ